MSCTTGEEKGKAKREWAAHWHGLATVTGLQHESLWLAHRTTTAQCSEGHVRHATASEQLPLGPMLDALRAPPVPPGRNFQNSEHAYRYLDTPSSNRSCVTSSSTQPSDFNHPYDFAQRELKQPVSRCQEHLSQRSSRRHFFFSQCHMEMLHL